MRIFKDENRIFKSFLLIKLQKVFLLIKILTTYKMLLIQRKYVILLQIIAVFPMQIVSNTKNVEDKSKLLLVSKCFYVSHAESMLNGIATYLNRSEFNPFWYHLEMPLVPQINVSHITQFHYNTVHSLVEFPAFSMCFVHRVQHEICLARNRVISQKIIFSNFFQFNLIETSNACELK